MNLQNTIEKYIDKGHCFDPDCDRENEILAEFKETNPILTDVQTRELILTLRDRNEDWSKKYFVADLLYYYDTFDSSLMEHMLQTAIDIGDPSFNRIFIRPCLKSFGGEKVVHWFLEKFQTAAFKERVRFSSIMYWLNISGADTSELRDALTKAADMSDNLIELYFYKLALNKDRKVFENVPNDAVGLCKVINGNKEYERLLYDELGWARK